MKSFLKSGATILLTPSPEWDWMGWDGRLSVNSLHKPLGLSADNIIIESDVPLFKLLGPQSYTAKGFSDVPGMIATAFFTVDQQTLADQIKVNNLAPLLIDSTGRFTCNYASPSQKITPGGPVPDPMALKTGTWRVVDCNQQVFFKEPINGDSPCKDTHVPSMSHREKMASAIKQSNIGEAALNEVGGIGGIATSLAVGGGVMVALALIPGGIFVEAVGAALLLAGAALSGYEIGQGINSMVDFYKKTDAAKTCPELADAGTDFSDGVAKIGIGGINAALSVAGARAGAKTATKKEIINRSNNATKGLKFENIGSATYDEAMLAGKKFVGENPTQVLAKDGSVKELVSKDGLKRFRSPRFKKGQGKTQANFETRPNTDVKFGDHEAGTTNAHLDITD
ncbi:MAG: hypothetical protein QM737_01165 [Ferruginibacter sp.]